MAHHRYATQQLAAISFVIACKELKIAQIV